MHPAIGEFLEGCRERVEREAEPCEAVAQIAPLMHSLLRDAESFLEPSHLRADPSHYSRNAIYIDPEQHLSLFAIVWTPGQWTPIHDHGSWGVVGVVRGTLQERNYVRMDGVRDRNDSIELRRGGILLLDPGTVTSFVPNPDHIHVTGVPETSPAVVSLHLYGRNMDSFHIYDVASRSRRLVRVEHNES